MEKLNGVSNFKEAKKKAINYLGSDVIFNVSNRKNKKYMVFNPTENKFIHFGDSTFSKDLIKRKAYWSRATNIKGNWKDNKYSPNNLSINILW